MADGGCQLEQMDGLIDGDIWTEEKKTAVILSSLYPHYIHHRVWKS